MNMIKDTVKRISFAEQVCYNNVQVAVFFCVYAVRLWRNRRYSAHICNLWCICWCLLDIVTLVNGYEQNKGHETFIFSLSNLLWQS